VSRRTVLAAGGVLWRRDPVDPEVALVHRPQYDDWSLPKGKAKPGEHLLVTALREMTEETGFRARLGPYLTTVRYRVSSNGQAMNKEVTYWSMRATTGAFQVSREVDAMRWLRLDDARRHLTSASDRVVLDTFVRGHRDTEPLLLVRHGATQAPARRVKQRPESRRLNRSGQQQAAAMVPILQQLGVGHLLSADVPACYEMLAPYAEAAGLTVRRVAELTRSGFERSARDVADLVRRDASAMGPLVVVGPHRVVAGLVHALGHADAVRPPHEASVRKGGWWLLHHRGGAIRAYERHEPAA
jgi:8-oxo-dGTP diphosphatase